MNIQMFAWTARIHREKANTSNEIDTVLFYLFAAFLFAKLNISHYFTICSNIQSISQLHEIKQKWKPLSLNSRAQKIDKMKFNRIQ